MAFHIIIADDDEDDRLIISEAVQSYAKKQVTITTVNDGVELLTELNNCFGDHLLLPDVILLDINMPKLDGPGALQIIKQDKRLRNIPVILVSTLRSIAKLKECITQGASKYYIKPNDIRGYERMVSDIFEKN
jgi:CheY-like chemotaxis protein